MSTQMASAVASNPPTYDQAVYAADVAQEVHQEQEKGVIDRKYIKGIPGLLKALEVVVCHSVITNRFYAYGSQCSCIILHFVPGVFSYRIHLCHSICCGVHPICSNNGILQFYFNGSAYHYTYPLCHPAS